MSWHSTAAGVGKRLSEEEKNWKKMKAGLNRPFSFYRPNRTDFPPCGHRKKRTGVEETGEP